MKLEFLTNISDNGRFSEVETDCLMRLYDFNQSEAAKFKEAIQHSLLNNGNELVLEKTDFVKAINCSLTLRICDSDTGITTDDNTTFFCDLTVREYEHILTLIEPFCNKDLHGYQWLYDLDTPIDFLFSPRGSWEEK